MSKFLLVVVAPAIAASHAISLADRYHALALEEPAEAAAAGPVVAEGDLESHKGVQGKMSYHGYDKDWHTEYKGDIHQGAHASQKEAFQKDFLHKEYVQNGPPPSGATFAGLALVALLVQ